MKIFRKNQILTVFLFFYFLWSHPFYAVANQPKSLMEKAFFYKDIANFRGPFLKSPVLRNNTIAEPFEAKCSNLNRIILPFYMEEKNSSGVLIFNLYQNNKEKKLVFSTAMNLKNFPPPKKIGTHDVDGVLYYIWIPPQPDSKNMNYLWELKADEMDKQVKTGLYMNNNPHPQLRPVVIDGVAQDTTYVAFYSYCQYRFEWDQAMKTTWDRFKQEKIFLVFYLMLMVGIVLGIKLTKNENADI